MQKFDAPAPNDAVRKTATLIKGMIPSNGSLVGVGIGVQGMVDSAGQTALLFAPQAWAGEVPLVSLLQEQLGWKDNTSITLINTQHAGALGEHRSGAGQGTSDMIFISTGDSIGAGLVLAGELYLGASGSAGELGHIVVDPSGPRCTCGNIGCLEALAGGAAVIAMTYKTLQEQGRNDLLIPSGRKSGSLTLQDIVDAAGASDMAALAAVRQAGEYLGLAIAGLVNTLNPSLVLVGGKLAETGDTLIAPLRQAILRRASPAAYSTVEVAAASLGSQSAAIGAAVLAIDRYLLSYS